MVEFLKGWKTWLFNILAMLLPILDLIGTVGAIPEVRGIIPDHYWPMYTLFMAIVNMILRKYTSTPLGKKE
jgi:hypothetical protein